METRCHEIAELVANLRKTKAGFDADLQSGGLDRAKIIQQDLENKIAAFYEQLLPVEFRELIKNEGEALDKFFGKHVSIPSLPESITLEKFKYWESIGFELHYLPAEEMKSEKDFPGWNKKPSPWFYEKIRAKSIAEDSAMLRGGWILIDGRPKPEYQSGDQAYVDDSLAETLTKLRKSGNLLGYKIAASRFDISWDELRDGEVKAAFAELLHTVPEDIQLPRAIEWNFIGNVHHPEWGDTNSWEWFQDEFIAGGGGLYGGRLGNGGLSNVGVYASFVRDSGIGFRLLVRFAK
ncbi:hypothetical protein EPO05_05110 [Patescibacteria group bacterium]|nr:MAG: hypothetical protein EPO05_05110 [Patescibacteria group bacterium]